MTHLEITLVAKLLKIAYMRSKIPAYALYIKLHSMIEPDKKYPELDVGLIDEEVRRNINVTTLSMLHSMYVKELTGLAGLLFNNSKALSVNIDDNLLHHLSMGANRLELYKSKDIFIPEYNTEDAASLITLLVTDFASYTHCLEHVSLLSINANQLKILYAINVLCSVRKSKSRQAALSALFFCFITMQWTPYSVMRFYSLNIKAYNPDNLWANHIWSPVLFQTKYENLRPIFEWIDINWLENVELPPMLNKLKLEAVRSYRIIN